jgi:hypothetical protein
MTGIGLQGDLISMSYYMKKDASGNKEVRPYLEVEFFRADADSNGFASNLSTGLTYPILTDSYSQYVFQTFIPANTRYFSARYEWIDDNFSYGSGVVTPLFLDQVALGLSQAGISVILCTQANLITIDNDTTETNFL